MSRTGLAITVAAMLVTAGCGGGGGSVTVNSSSSTTSNTTSSPTSSATSQSTTSSSPDTSSPTSSSSDGSSSAGALPEGFKRADVSAHKISFGVPKLWVLVDPSTMDDQELQKALAPMAKSSGTTPQALAQQVKTQLTAIYFSPVAEDGFSENLNVNKKNFRKSAGLPTEAQLLAGISPIGGKTESYTKRDSPVGEGVVYNYSLPTQGKTAYGAMIVLPNGTSGYSLITVSAGKADRTKTLTDAIYQSVQNS